jgi:hypothetical protein
MGSFGSGKCQVPGLEERMSGARVRRAKEGLGITGKSFDPIRVDIL